jgi:hypothetical protein
MSKTDKKISKTFVDTVISKADYKYNLSKKTGKLIVEYQSGIQYHHQKVDYRSVQAFFNHSERYDFSAYNKYIAGRHFDKKVVYTKKWKDAIAAERKKQYLAKANARRRNSKQKERESSNA